MTPSTATPAYYALPEAPAAASCRHGASLLAVFGGHLLLLGLIAGAAGQPELAPPLRALAVRLLEAPTPPQIAAPKPVPPKTAPRKSVAPPVMAAPSVNANTATSFAVAPQPEPVAASAVHAPAPVVAARFDADYLQNPKPVYPPISRRMGEEGKVVLRVRVSAQGVPLAVEIRQSSGFARLDEAAKAAVERWRFVPARQGAEPVESSVLVPLNFTLNN